MFRQSMLYYGREITLPEPLPLRAGPLRLLYDQGDLRSICHGDDEVLRRVYVSIRDRNWGTITPVFSKVDIQVEADHFAIRYAVENREDEIHFAWRGEIRGKADGTITFVLDGTALSTFWKNRIGFCVLHPASLAGQPAIVEHTDGTTETTHFAEDICADQPVMPFADLRAIRHLVAPGVWAEVQMSGDIFEMEDQRLWTDASYKTFCTPLHLPYPVEIQAGSKIAQAVTLRLLKDGPAERQKVSATGGRAVSAPGPIRLTQTADWKPAPPMGLSIASHIEDLSEREVERLRSLNLHHLRVEISLADADYSARLRQAGAQASALGIPLELALRVSMGAAQKELAGFRQVLDAIRPWVCGWLVFPAHEPYTGGRPSEAIAREAAQVLKSYDRSIPLAVGSNTDFIFLKRTILPEKWMDQVCITLNPQVHAFDNQSMIETLEAQPAVVESARRLAKGLPVVVSPITLKPRFNPYATGAQPEPVPGKLPDAVDVRQITLFAAGWTLGSLRAMAASGAARVTYYETTGWRGVMETEQGSPQGFPSISGSVFPLYHVLADYGEFAGGQAAELSSSGGLRVSGLALRKQGRLRYLLANHRAEDQTVLLEVPGEFAIRCLDETIAESAMMSPEAFRRRPEGKIRATGKGLQVVMRPFGVIRLDWSVS